jgi:hypothetical protein
MSGDDLILSPDQSRVVAADLMLARAKAFRNLLDTVWAGGPGETTAGCGHEERDLLGQCRSCGEVRE